MHRIAVRCAVVLALALPIAARAQAPKSGIDVLEMMRKKYAGKWYETLIFHQTTTLYRGDSATKQTWHESLHFTPESGARLRIDVGDPANGNGTLSTWDSTWSMREGKLGRVRGDGNPFLALIENVYLEPATTTAHQLEPLAFDMSKVTSGTIDGRSAWIVGVSDVSDSTQPQFWVDKDRLVVVRFMVSFAPNSPLADIHLDKFVETGGGWLATRVAMTRGGKPLQLEEYYDWKTRVALDPALFNPATWTTAKHWAK